jgi:ring-1,2-phenylacetyl-CoA epoxidase subunit PaaD
VVIAIQDRHPGEGRDLGTRSLGGSPPDPGLRRDDGIWAVLESVPDPEIPVVSVVDLGIVRAVTPDLVTITPT